MRRWIAFISLFLIACQAVSLIGTDLPTATGFVPAPTATFTQPPAPSPTASSTPFPPTASATLAQSTAATTAPPENASFTLRLHPDGPIYVGDQVSFEVIAPAQADLQGSSAQVRLADPQGSLNAEAGFGKHGIGGRQHSSCGNEHCRSKEYEGVSAGHE